MAMCRLTGTIATEVNPSRSGPERGDSQVRRRPVSGATESAAPSAASAASVIGSGGNAV